VSGIAYDGFVISGPAGLHQLQEPCGELADVSFLPCREEKDAGDGSKLFLRFPRAQAVDFVAGQQQVLVFGKACPQLFRAPAQLLRAGLPGVEQVDDDAGLLYLLKGSAHPNRLDGVGGFADAGSVDEAEADAPDGYFVFDGIAGGACDFGYDGSLLIEQGVEQGGLACVGLAGDGYRHPVLDNVAQGEGVGEASGDCVNAQDELLQVVTVGKLHVFLAEVQLQLNKGGEVEELLSQVADFGREAAPHLLHGQLVGGSGAGGDEVGHRFGLGEIQLAVEEGAEGKLPGLCQPCLSAKEELKDLLLYVGRAMAGYLYSVLAGVGVGGFEKAYQHFVQHGSLIMDHPEMDGVGLLRFQVHRFQLPGGKYLVADAYSLAARKPDHCDGCGAAGGGRGCYGILCMQAESAHRLQKYKKCRAKMSSGLMQGKKYYFCALIFIT
jgi:hypothetical protein